MDDELKNSRYQKVLSFDVRFKKYDLDGLFVTSMIYDKVQLTELNVEWHSYAGSWVYLFRLTITYLTSTWMIGCTWIIQANLVEVGII